MSLNSGALTRSIGRTVLKTKKNSPHIFFAFGLAGVVTSTVLACRATLKLEKTVDEIKEEFEKISGLKKASENGGPSYDQDEYMRDLAYAYIHGITKMVKLYGPSVAIGGVSIGMLTGSHVQLTHRNQALTAALTAVSQAYDEYRNRVKEAIGEEKEMAIYQGCLLDDPDDEAEIDKLREIGKVTNHASPYGRFFERSNVNWQKDMEFNRIFIQCQQTYANHLLQSRGHVFLNEVYDALGFDRTQAGAVVGWVRDGDGDGFIDFGLFDITNMQFIDGNADGCLLDFNVDGVVYDKI
jgi:Family of unknown function (DUF6353)